MGKNKKKTGTALTSLTRRERLQKASGVPKRDPVTGVVTVSPVDIRPGGPIIRALDKIKAKAKAAVKKIPKPPKEKGKVSEEHKASTTRRGMGVLKKKK